MYIYIYECGLFIGEAQVHPRSMSLRRHRSLERNGNFLAEEVSEGIILNIVFSALQKFMSLHLLF